MMANFNNEPLSLQNVVLGTLAATLLKEPNILLSISKFQIKSQQSTHDNLQVWEETIEIKFVDGISKLGLPKSLSKLLIDMAKRMGGQVRNWKKLHEEYLEDSKGEVVCFDVLILEKLRWTAAWLVDYRKTAEELIRSGALDSVKKFKLACLYCLEDYVPVFWRELSTENQKYFYTKKGRYLYNGGLGQEFWWPYIIKGQDSKLDDLTRSERGNQSTFHQYAFQCSTEKGNKTAAEYFYQKLTHQEKEISVMSATKELVDRFYSFRYFTHNQWSKVFPIEKAAEVFRFLLSVMTPHQQMRIFQEKPVDILLWFLDWPLQDMFLEIADIIWLCMSDSDRDEVLCFIYKDFKKSDDYCVKLFQDFFRRIPSDFWIGFADRQCVSRSHFDFILFFQDIKDLEILFRSLNDAARRRLMFSERALETFHSCLAKGELGFVEACLREASLSQEDKRRLREDFMRYLTSIKVNEMRLKTRKWSKFFNLLDETNSDGKRGLEGETPTEVKKRKVQL